MSGRVGDDVFNDRGILVDRLVSALDAIHPRHDKVQLMPFLRFDPCSLQYGKLQVVFLRMHGHKIISSAMKKWPLLAGLFLSFAATALKVIAGVHQYFKTEFVYLDVARAVKLALQRRRIDWRVMERGVEILELMYADCECRQTMLDHFPNWGDVLGLVFCNLNCPLELFVTAKRVHDDALLILEQQKAMDDIHNLTIRDNDASGPAPDNVSSAFI